MFRIIHSFFNLLKNELTTFLPSLIRWINFAFGKILSFNGIKHIKETLLEISPHILFSEYLNGGTINFSNFLRISCSSSIPKFMNTLDSKSSHIKIHALPQYHQMFQIILKWYKSRIYHFETTINTGLVFFIVCFLLISFF